MRRLPSSWSIIWADNACIGITTGAAFVLFIGLMVKLTGTLPGKRGGPDIPVHPGVASMVLAGAAGLSLLLSAIVARRVARFRSLFERGLEIEADVQRVKRLRGGTTLKLEYELDGICYKVSFKFLRSSRTPEFSEGTRIPVLVDPANPKRAIPLDLYGDPGAAR